MLNSALGIKKKKKMWFGCPFIGCGKIFRLASNLRAHYRVEVTSVNLRSTLGLLSVKSVKYASEKKSSLINTRRVAGPLRASQSR